MSWLINAPLTRFIAQIVVILVAARLLGRVARRLRQPPVVAEIVAGIVLGPSLLGWLAPGAAAALFPIASLEPLRMASELGLVLFVFLVGLELDPRMLRGRVQASFVIAFASIAVPFVLGSMLALPLSGFVGPEGSVAGLALFIGGALSVTAVPVHARILIEHRMLRTRLGALAVASAAIDDAIAWCVLAFVVAFARADGGTGALLTTGMAIAFVVAIVFVVRPVLDRAVDRISTPLTVTHDTVAGVMIAMFTCAWITERIGIHLVFGAFAFGAVLPRRDGFARAIAEKLEDLVIVILLPLFFAISGLRTQIDLALSVDHIAACGAVVIVAIAAKLGGSTLAGRLTGLSWRDAGALGVLMNTRGLVELIVLNIGLDLGVISPALFSMMVVMVLVTTVATSPILRRIYPPKEAVRDLLAAESRPKADAGHRVMACISHDRVGPSLVTMAHAIVGAPGEAIALHLSRLDERSTTGDDGPDAAAVLEPALASAEQLGLALRPLAFSSSDFGDDIVRVADIRDVDLVLLGVHKPLLGQAMLGGVVHEVLQHAAGTVAVHVDRGMPASPRRVLVPFQGSRHDRAALELAARIQASTGAAVTVLELAPAARAGAAREIVDSMHAEGFRADVESLATDSPAAATIERSRDVDLVVVGVGREWGLRPQRVGFGFNAERLIRECAASLLVVRGPHDGLAVARIEEE
jgi:Kef-type K+ transport system membrane component KefB